jgi:hypothetical protein
MIREGPVGCAEAGNASGWMQEAEFLLFLEHFKKQVKPTVDHDVRRSGKVFGRAK